jgi:hypothetical protein
VGKTYDKDSKVDDPVFSGTQITLMQGIFGGTFTAWGEMPIGTKCPANEVDLEGLSYYIGSSDKSKKYKVERNEWLYMVSVCAMYKQLHVGHHRCDKCFMGL